MPGCSFAVAACVAAHVAAVRVVAAAAVASPRTVIFAVSMHHKMIIELCKTVRKSSSCTIR